MAEQHAMLALGVAQIFIGTLLFMWFAFESTLFTTNEESAG